MRLVEWDKLPENIKNDEVKYYYEILYNKRIYLILKRLFDICIAFIALVLLSPIMLVIAIAIKIDSRGPVFYRQLRVTQYGRMFRIFKFRTMITNADKIGTHVTIGNDPRITNMGNKIRKLRLDEIPQLINVIFGDMSFVGTRPEVPKYVNKYTNEMMGTLLFRAGITSDASIKFKDEDKLLHKSNDIDKDYIEKVLPLKMRYNLEYLNKFNYIYDLKVMIKTMIAVVNWEDY